MKKEIAYNMPMQSYRELPGLSKHQLDSFSVCPAYYKHQSTQEWKPSRQMELGTLAHSHVLEGRVEYALGPSVDRRTTKGKEEWQKFCEDNIGKTVVNVEEYSQLQGLYESASKFIENLIDKSQRDVEASMFWGRAGVDCKGRPDLICTIDGQKYIIDLKTTTGIQYWDSKFFSLRYNVQAEWYSYGLRQITGEKVNFGFVVADFAAPHLVQFVEMDEALMNKTFLFVQKEIEYFSKCAAADKWPGLPQKRTISAR